ncbi:hypothetical protein F5887DRAFT_915707 [Amanita rubescens]|nr:hypothetical protein F5887DRAFT_915707 [Amanita rubescens]
MKSQVAFCLWISNVRTQSFQLFKHPTSNAQHPSPHPLSLLLRSVHPYYNATSVFNVLWSTTKFPFALLPLTCFGRPRGLKPRAHDKGARGVFPLPWELPTNFLLPSATPRFINPTLKKDTTGKKKRSKKELTLSPRGFLRLHSWGVGQSSPGRGEGWNKRRKNRTSATTGRTQLLNARGVYLKDVTRQGVLPRDTIPLRPARLARDRICHERNCAGAPKGHYSSRIARHALIRTSHFGLAALACVLDWWMMDPAVRKKEKTKWKEVVEASSEVEVLRASERREGTKYGCLALVTELWLSETVAAILWCEVASLIRITLC